MHRAEGRYAHHDPDRVRDKIGIRPVVSKARARCDPARDPGLPAEENANWKPPLPGKLEKIKSGDLLQVASVIKSLLLRERERGLSTGRAQDAAQRQTDLPLGARALLGIGYKEAEQSMDEALALDS
jgi:CarD family transcriptional regulator